MQSKLKVFTAATLGAIAIAAGGLATAPSASAQPRRGDCSGYALQAVSLQYQGNQAWASGYRAAAYAYWGASAAYAQLAADCYGG